MTVPRSGQDWPAAAIFDLDRAVIDSTGAWRYTVEESVASVLGRRVDASGLVAEYHGRPWNHALSILIPRGGDSARAEAFCERIFVTSALKRLTVFEGIGMTLDQLRVASIELGCISRLPHRAALQQIQSTGLDRFFAVLAAAGPDGGFDAGRQISRCLGFLERRPAEALFVGSEIESVETAADLGLITVIAGWGHPPEETSFRSALRSPRDLPHAAGIRD